MLSLIEECRGKRLFFITLPNAGYPISKIKERSIQEIQVFCGSVVKMVEPGQDCREVAAVRHRVHIQAISPALFEDGIQDQS